MRHRRTTPEEGSAADIESVDDIADEGLETWALHDDVVAEMHRMGR